MMVKLLIPRVSDYKDCPEKFVYNRVLALYTHIQYTLISRADAVKKGEKEIAWKDEALVKFWGKINKENAQKYNDEVKNAGIADLV
ncbi:MAG: hypothetical protein GY754_07740 [bacterium]|nr:hypothetical protein [bacterium]